MNKALFFCELLRMRRSLATQLLLVFALLVSFYSVWSGSAWQMAQQNSLDQYVETVEEKSSEWRADLTAIENGEGESSPYTARPMDIQLPAVHKTGATSHMAIGMTEIMPARLVISPRRNGMSMIAPYEFDNPMTLLFGRMDFVFFVTIIAPLLLIALNFDVIASDRAQGLSKMLLSNPVTETTVIANRMIARSSILIFIVLLALIFGLTVADNLTFSDAASWVTLVLAYLFFWIGLIFLIVSQSQRGFSGLSKLVSLWLLFALIIPAASNSITTYLFPQPSKLELLSDARSATSEATKQTAELTQRFLEDHPELTIGDDQVPGYYRALFLSNSVVRESTQPIMKDFSESMKDREDLLDTLQYLSPTTILQRSLIAIAQTDSRSHSLFLETAGQYLSNINNVVEDSVLTSNRISVDTFDQIKIFDEIWEATQKPSVSIFSPIAFMVFLGLVLIGFTRKNSKS